MRTIVLTACFHACSFFPVQCSHVQRFLRDTWDSNWSYHECSDIGPNHSTMSVVKLVLLLFRKLFHFHDMIQCIKNYTYGARFGTSFSILFGTYTYLVTFMIPLITATMCNVFVFLAFSALEKVMRRIYTYGFNLFV